MEFEFDPAKSETNREKHGIDFLEAQQLWQDQDAMVLRRARKNEERYYHGNP